MEQLPYYTLVPGEVALCRSKHLLRYWPILARSSTLHFAGAVNTRQESQCTSLTWSILSFQTGPVKV